MISHLKIDDRKRTRFTSLAGSYPASLSSLASVASPFASCSSPCLSCRLCRPLCNPFLLSVVFPVKPMLRMRLCKHRPNIRQSRSHTSINLCPVRLLVYKKSVQLRILLRHHLLGCLKPPHTNKASASSEPTCRWLPRRS